MDLERFKNFLLAAIPGAKLASGGREILCRCRYCPDSPDPSHAHMYIKVPQNSTQVPLYNCFLCHSSSVLTAQKLTEWGIYNPDIAIELTEHLKNCTTIKSNWKYFDRTIYKVYVTKIRNEQISIDKLNYINNRLGLSLNLNDIRNLKIVLNLGDLLQSNWINKLTRNEKIVVDLDRYFVGFLSIDNAFCNMRRICKEGIVNHSIDKRYINYKIFDKFDTSERFYTIPTSIDLNSPYPIKLHIAEGPFDILSIYKNLRKEEPGIYTSIAGSNYIGQILYFLQTFKLPWVEIHLYPDNDSIGSKETMDNINMALAMFNFPMYIHRNQYPGEKDFGVSPNKIRESIDCIRR